MRLQDALLDQARGRRRLPVAEVWRAWQQALPVEAASTDARARLWAHLAVLASSGAIELPAPRGKAWDRTAEPPLPAWIGLPRPKRPSPSFDPRSTPWAPELAFLATAPVEPLDAAYAVQRFLAEGGRSRPLVPLRERSVELFGHEKRLEELLRTPLFGPDRLTLAVLRCFAMAPPLVFEAGPPGRPCLVVENHHTWWSFAQWNRRLGVYSAVVYGAGGGIGADAVRFLAEEALEWRAPRGPLLRRPRPRRPHHPLAGRDEVRGAVRAPDRPGGPLVRAPPRPRR